MADMAGSYAEHPELMPPIAVERDLVTVLQMRLEGPECID